jgi:CheY-like chemotaxis protein
MESANRLKPENWPRPRVLLVEDDVLVRLLVAEGLRQERFEVLEAASAEEALSLLDSGVVVDVVFTDIQMPGAQNGLDLARLTRERHPGIGLLLTSGGLLPHEIPGDWRSAFLRKPYSVEELARLLVRHGRAGNQGASFHEG